MAALLKCSAPTIHSVESGRLKLSAELAEKIFHETGVPLDWLLAGDPKSPPIAANGDPYTRETFDLAQASKIHYDKVGDWQLSLEMMGLYGQLRSILASASKGKSFHMAAYKTRAAVEALRNEFGQDLALYPDTDPNKTSVRHAQALMRADLELNEMLADQRAIAMHSGHETKFTPPDWKPLFEAQLSEHDKRVNQRLTPPPPKKSKRPSGPSRKRKL